MSGVRRALFLTGTAALLTLSACAPASPPSDGPAAASNTATAGQLGNIETVVEQIEHELDSDGAS